MREYEQVCYVAKPYISSNSTLAKKFLQPRDLGISSLMSKFLPDRIFLTRLRWMGDVSIGWS